MKIDSTLVRISILVFLAITISLTSGLAQQPKTKANEPAPLSLSHLKEKGTLLVGVDIPYGVMEFYDASGKPAGIDMELATEIASRLGVAMEAKTMPFSKLFEALKAGEVDVVISAVTITPERQKTMLFSAPYLNAGMSIAVRKDNQDIRSLADLKNRRVGVLKGTVGEELVLKSAHITPSLVKSYQENEERIQDLIEGELDAIVVHFLIKDQPSIKIVGEPLSESYYGIVTRLNNETLMKEINRILKNLKQSEKLREIIRKYLK